MGRFNTIYGFGSNGFMSRLGRDTRGNLMAMTAAAAIPMIGVVGGAIDASRMYMVRSRLQAACDSAVLAGRKAMVNATYDASIAKPRADAMFNFNFKNSDFQTKNTAFNATADSSGRLTGIATTTMPMTLMKMFGFGDQTQRVSCSADIQIPNIDVVFVLDSTGSMACKTDGTTCTNGSTSKMAALKTAAINFYDRLDAQLAANGTNAGRIRYGFVPYDQTVRVTDLFKASPDTSKGEASLTNLVNAMTVQSRTANFRATTVWAQPSPAEVTTYTQTFKGGDSDTKQPYIAKNPSGATAIDQSACDSYAANKNFKVGNTTYSMDPAGAILYIPSPKTSSDAQTTQPTSGSYYYELTFSRVTATIDKNKTDYCQRKVTKKKFVSKVVNQFAYWSYKPVSLDTSTFKTGAAVSYVSDLDSGTFTAPSAGEYNMLDLAKVANKTGLTVSTTRWTGCIEERDTTAATNFSPIPAAAKDLNVLQGGTSDDFRWRPIFNDLTWYRGGPNSVDTTSDYTQMTSQWYDPSAGWYDNPYIQCPVASVRNLNVMTRTEFVNYINTLTPGGNTYLDLGMVWGLRLIVPQGMWGSRNLVGPNGGQISRHIIFLTDGEPVSNAYSYSGYGMEIMAERITHNTNTAAATLHAARFQALCDTQRGTVNIWAIAFGTSVTGNLSQCADPGRAYQADNASQLNAAFDNIARTIADLRLVQ